MIDPVWIAPLLALLASMLYGSCGHFIRRGLRSLDPQRGAAVSIVTTFVCFLAAGPLWMDRSAWWTVAAGVFAVSGLLHPILSRYCAYESNKRVGATVGMTLDSTAPLFGAGLAVFFLGETFTWMIALGTFVTVFGVMFLYWSPIVPSSVIRTAIGFSLGAATMRAVGMVAAKFGLTLVANPMLAAFCAFAVSSAVSLSILKVQKKPILVAFFGPGSAWFITSGLVSAVATVCLYNALLRGQVIVVVPIISAAPLFTLLVAVALGLETLTRKIVIGVLITVVGVVVVSVAPSLG